MGTYLEAQLGPPSPPCLFLPAFSLSVFPVRTCPTCFAAPRGSLDPRHPRVVPYPRSRCRAPALGAAAAPSAPVGTAAATAACSSPVEGTCGRLLLGNRAPPPREPRRSIAARSTQPPSAELMPAGRLGYSGNAVLVFCFALSLFSPLCSLLYPSFGRNTYLSLSTNSSQM